MPLVSLLAAAAVAAALPPTGPWNVEALEDLCLLSRRYGDGPDSLVVGFQPIFTQQQMELIVLTPSRAPAQETGTATIVRQPDGRTFSGTFFSVGVKGGRRFTRITLDRALFDELGDTSALAIKAGRVRTNVGIVRFAKARPVFQTCERDLLQTWGVDPASLAEGRQATSPDDIATYFRARDYPRDALSQGNIGRVTAVLNIDAAGKVTGCRPVVGAGATLNAATCTRAALIPFVPGKDAAGKPAPSIYILNVRWQMGYG